VSRRTCKNSTRNSCTVFPPRPDAPRAQTCERNRSRTEARCLIPFDTTAPAVNFPFVAQAARLTRCIDSDAKPTKGIETEFLLSSCTSQQLNPELLLAADRGYWGIETGLHLRLDVIAGEDRGRVRNRTSALNLAMIRRAVVSVAIAWIRKCPNKRKATMSGFYDAMAAKQARKAFSLVTTSYPSWLPGP
jgi:predicted transposase YbfD/YdcC